MARQFYDYNNELNMLASRGVVRIPDYSSAATRTIEVDGRYLDPVSGRLSELSRTEYFRRPVNSWLQGRGAGFPEHGQKSGKIYVKVGPERKKEKERKREGGGEPKNNWKCLKIYFPEDFQSTTGSYTNMPSTGH